MWGGGAGKGLAQYLVENRSSKKAEPHQGATAQTHKLPGLLAPVYTSPCQVGTHVYPHAFPSLVLTPTQDGGDISHTVPQPNTQALLQAPLSPLAPSHPITTDGNS